MSLWFGRGDSDALLVLCKVTPPMIALKWAMMLHSGKGDGTSKSEYAQDCALEFVRVSGPCLVHVCQQTKYGHMFWRVCRQTDVRKKRTGAEHGVGRRRKWFAWCEQKKWSRRGNSIIQRQKWGTYLRSLHFKYWIQFPISPLLLFRNCSSTVLWRL